MVPRSLSEQLFRRLKELRKAHNLTQEAFCERTGISYKYYQSLEAGRKRDLRLSTLERLATAYGIEVFELLSPNLPAPSKIRAIKRVNRARLNR